MSAISIHHNDVIAKLVPGGSENLRRFSDDELLTNTRRLVGKSNQLLAALLEHLAEVETRGIHRTRSCASLYTYCIYELRFSEDAAARRSAAARFAKEFPALLAAVAAGELHLTGLLMIGPHLTLENHESVLARAKFRTRKELSRLVRELHPLPELPDCIEPLGPAPARASMNPTWAEFVRSLSPEVRELREGERPRDWANDGVDATVEGAPSDGDSDSDSEAADDETLPVGPGPAESPPITAPQRFQMQFGTVEEHVRLVERAKALLARTRPGVTLGELHLEAMELLVTTLEKRKHGAAERPPRTDHASAPGQRRQHGHMVDTESQPPTPADGHCAAHDEAREVPVPTRPRRAALEVGEGRGTQRGPRQRAAVFGGAEHKREPHAPRQRGTVDEVAEPCPTPRGPNQRSRHIPAAVRREVYRRDNARCTFVDVRGHRCCETRYLELHHLQPFARSGCHSVSNLTLRCAAHNALAAEEDFGREHVAERRHSARHETLAAQTRPATTAFK